MAGNWTMSLNTDPTRTDRPDLADLNRQLNPILQKIVSALQATPDPTGDGLLPATFSKIHISLMGP